MTRPRPTPREIDDWVLSYADGESLREIARASAFSHETVREHLVQRGVELRPVRNGGHGREFVARWSALYESGVSFYAIAARYRVSYSGVRRVLLRHGVRSRSLRDAQLARYQQ